MDRSVNIWGEAFIVSVDQKSKTVWIAVGDHLGKRIQRTGRTASDAVRAWKAAALYRGN